ncbi:MAG: hypothetical protein KBD62_37300 [Kofleriaceae bacterium]|nr:hypothetical protein [Kofleriaceae bacterium]
MADMDDAIQAMDPLSDEDLVRDVENMAGELLRARTTLARLTADLAAVTSERDMWRSECESISAELDLPPGIRPAEGEFRRMLDHRRALLAERDALGRSLDASASTVALLSEQVGRAEKDRDEARGLLGRIGDWTHQFGAALCPTAGSADSFGDGMREAKRQVATIVAAHLGRSE